MNLKKIVGSFLVLIAFVLFCVSVYNNGKLAGKTEVTTLCKNGVLASVKSDKTFLYLKDQYGYAISCSEKTSEEK